jgi:aminocarboxymuconate-semialdehyde decarboxylase
VLSDPVFDVVWEEHERLDVPVVVHPATGMEEHVRPEHAAWEMPIVYGYLVDEGMAVADLICNGVLDKHPGLHAHIPHAGGFAPYQKGRLSEAVKRRPWAKDAVSRTFEEMWDQLSFDTAVHNDDALEFLVRAEGPSKIMIGSNFAGWDQDPRTVTRILELPVDDATKRAILSENAERIFHLDL